MALISAEIIRSLPATAMQSSIKAIFFDVFGTLVDWRSSIAREARDILTPLGYQLDWSAFADAWRAEYQPAMEQVRSGHIPFCKLDVLHLHNLEQILPRFHISGLDDATKRNLNLAWHRLDAWPDTSAGLHRLKRKFMIAPVSNGNISLMVALARRNDLPWDAILGSEIAGDFKPKPRVYLAACGAFDLVPAQCMMAAAHPNDLAAAASCGLRTGYISRPDEKGRSAEYTAPKQRFDVNATSVVELAEKLGA
jgi:2-haloacid dehalogenase